MIKKLLILLSVNFYSTKKYITEPVGTNQFILDEEEDLYENEILDEKSLEEEYNQNQKILQETFPKEAFEEKKIYDKEYNQNQKLLKEIFPEVIFTEKKIYEENIRRTFPKEVFNEGKIYKISKNEK